MNAMGPKIEDMRRASAEHVILRLGLKPMDMPTSDLMIRVKARDHRAWVLLDARISAYVRWLDSLRHDIEFREMIEAVEALERYLDTKVIHDLQLVN